MKTNIVNCRFFVTTLSCFILFLVGCDQDNQKDLIQDESTYAGIYADSAFLEIEGDLYDPEVIWGNVDIYLPAFERMQSHLKYKDNRLQWDFKNAAELKISENIYDYVIDDWKNKNEILESGEYKLTFNERGDYMLEPLSENIQPRVLSASRWLSTGRSA